MRLVLFDCDGTLADSFGLICETMRRCFADNGLTPPTDGAIHAIIGLSLDRAIARLVPSLQADRLTVLVKAYRASFRALREDLAFREALFPGIPELVEALLRRGDTRLGLVTGKTRRGVDAVLAAHALEGCFAVVRTADDCPSKPDPAMVLECCFEAGIEPAKTIVVGDAVFDMEMAVRAGARAVGVAWGAGTLASLERAGAAAVAADVDQLADILDAWLDTSRQPVEHTGATS